MLVEKTISAENTFTEWKYFPTETNVDLSISGLSDSTVTLQRKFKEYGSDILDKDTFSAATETYFFVASPAYYRVGIKTGDHGTDDVKVKLAA